MAALIYLLVDQMEILLILLFFFWNEGQNNMYLIMISNLVGDGPLVVVKAWHTHQQIKLCGTECGYEVSSAIILHGVVC